VPGMATGLAKWIEEGPTGITITRAPGGSNPGTSILLTGAHQVPIVVDRHFFKSMLEALPKLVQVIAESKRRIVETTIMLPESYVPVWQGPWLQTLAELVPEVHLHPLALDTYSPRRAAIKTIFPVKSLPICASASQCPRPVAQFLSMQDIFRACWVIWSPAMVSIRPLPRLSIKC